MTGRGRALALVALMLAGCGSTSAPTHPATPSVVARSAEDAVTGYLRAVASHDAAGARAYLAPEFQRRRATTLPRFEDWVADVVSLRLQNISEPVTPTGLEDSHPGYAPLAEFGVSYDSVFRGTTDETSGPQTRFFVVGRSPSGAWSIVDIGTGP